MVKTYLVIGDAGFLGINLIRYLLTWGHGVVSPDIAPFDHPDVANCVQVITEDVCDTQTAQSALKSPYLAGREMQSAEVEAVMRKIWDESASTYDDRPGHSIRSKQEKRAWQTLLSRAIGSEKCDILDVGCGTGVMALLLAEMGHRVTGLDISKAMLEKAREKAARLGLSVEFREGSAEALPFGNCLFDAVVNRHVLWALTDPEKAVAEWKRVLKPGGRVIIIDGNWDASGSLFRHLWRLFGQFLILVTERRDPRPSSRYRGIERYLPMRRKKRPDADVALLRKLGFEEVEVMQVKIPRTRTFLELLKYGHWADEFWVKGVVPR